MMFELFGRGARAKKNLHCQAIFRFSEALTEEGSYNADFNHYRPLQLAGDPNVMEYLPIKQASIVCNQLLDHAEERAENARSFLNAHGLRPESDLLDYWRRVERWLPTICEQSQEPAHQMMDAIRRPLRPMAQAFLYDLAFVYAQSTLEAYPKLRLGCTLEGIAPPDARGLPAFPVILNVEDQVRLYPGSVLQWAGVKAMAGQKSDVLVFGMRTLQEVSDSDSPHELIYQWVDAVHKRRGSLPTMDELVEFVMDNGWHADEVPSELIEAATKSC